MRGARPRRRPHGRGHGRRLELLRRLPRGLRAGAGRGRHAGRAGCDAGRPSCCRRCGPRCASTRRAPAHGRASPSPSPPSARRATPPGWPPRCSRCRAGSPPPASSGWRSRSTSSRRIAAFDGGNVEHALRAAVQDQRSVGYVFAGSEPSLMERMLTPRRPFYKAGPVMRLEKIDEATFARLHRARFTASGIRPEAGLGAAIVELAGNVPVRRAAAGARDLGRRAGRRAARRGARRSAPAR